MQIVNISRPKPGTDEYFRARTLLLAVASNEVVTQYLDGRWSRIGRDGLSTLHDYARSIGVIVAPSDGWVAPAGFKV